jgi:transcriptional regulator with XRE-family HTH domain
MTGARLQARAEAVIISHVTRTGELTAMAGLRPCRERAGMNLKELAKAAGICPETYRSWETGKTWPSAFHLANLATVLGVSIEELYLGPDPEGGQP